MRLSPIRLAALLVFVAWAVPLSGGCGQGDNGVNDCITSCNANQSCDTTVQLDCPGGCSAAASTAEAAGCTGFFEQMMRCTAPLANTCTSYGPCEEQHKTLESCVSSYCQAHPLAICP